MPRTMNLKKLRHMIMKFIISRGPEKSPRVPREATKGRRMVFF